MDDIELENKILEILSPIEPKWSNQVFGKLRVNKARYQRIRDKMIEGGWIHAEKKGRELLLTRMNFESSKFDNENWTNIARINCTNWLKYFQNKKPIFNKKKNVRTKEIKMMLDAYFHELDRQMIVCTRLVNAEALGLILSDRSKKHQKKCVDFVHEFIKKLLSDHKEFKEEIKEYSQSQVRVVRFKI
jgi:hypothetical protein